MKRIEPHIRWMIRRDMAEVLDIENRCFADPWTEEDFIRFLRRRNAIGRVAEYDDAVIGFTLHEQHKTRRHVASIAVDPEFHRLGVGQSLIEDLISRLSTKCPKLRLEVRETNLNAQVFFRDMGFKAVRVLSEFYDDTDEDAYLMEYRVSSRKAVTNG